MRSPLPLLVASLLAAFTAFNAAAQADLLVGPTSLEFAVPDGASQPLPQSVFVASSGAALTFAAHSTAPWLFVSQPWGTTPATPNVTVDANGLQKGVYHGYVSITSGPLTSALVDVTLTVGGSAAAALSPWGVVQPLGKTLRAFPRGLTFTARTGAGAPEPQSILVPHSATEDGVQAASSAGWLAVSPAKPGSFQELEVSVNPDGLARGQHTASVVLKTPVGAERTIPVTLNVGDDAHLVAEPSVLSFEARPGGFIPGLKTITIRNSILQNLNYTAASASGSWLAVGPQTGSTDGGNSITVAVNPANLSIGTNTGSITVTAPGAMEPLVIPVTFTVDAQAAGLSVDMQTLSFTGALGGPVQTQIVKLTSSIPNEAFNSQVVVSWLTITPATGTASTTPLNLTFSADPNAAGAGTSTANQTTLTGTSNDQVPFRITFTVSAGSAGTISASPTSLNFNFISGVTPSSQTIMLTGTSATSFTASSPFSFVTVTPSSGTTPATLTVSVNKSVTPGHYSGNIQVIGGVNGVSNPLNILVTIDVTAAGCIVSASGTPITKLIFSSFQGQGAPPSQTVQLSCNVTTSFTATPAQTFDTVTPSSGTITAGSSAPLTIAVAPGSLATGTHLDSIAINGTGIATPISLDINYTISSASQITANPSTLSFTQVAGGAAPPNQTIALTSGSPTTFTATINQNFLTVTPSSGTVTTSPTGAILTVAVNAVGMAPGVYQGHILIAGGNPTIDYIAQVTVTASGTTATITPSPTALTFSQVSGGALPASQTVTLTGSASTAYQATANVPWLTVNPASGTAATTGTALTVAVNSMSSTLGAGTFQATVTITGGATTATVGVTLTITNAATNAVTPTPSMLTFNSIAGGSSPGAQTVQLTSGATVNFTAASNQTWLLVNPTSGAITPTTAASLTVSVVTGSMGAGSYTGAITVTGGASPVSIPVTLNITAATTITPSPSSLTFVQLLGGAAPANQTVSLTAPTATPFSAAGTQPWLTVTSSATGTPATLTVAVNGATLAVGSYRDTITITGGSATVMIPVSLTILSGTGNAIVSDQAAVAFKQSLGDTSFKIQQVRLTALLPTSFTASSNVTWITVSPSDTATTPATLTLTEDPTGLAAGSYTGAVTVVGGVVPLTIQVLLTIATAPNAIAPTPTTVSFAQFLGGAAPVSQTVQLASATPTAFTVTNTQSWLTVTPSSGTTNTALTLAVSPSGLLAGTYQDTITVTGGALPITIPVSYTINPDTFLATPASLTFIQTLGGATPVAQSVQLTSALPHPFNITSNAAWLTVLPTTGTSPATLTVTANGAGLAAGTYNGALTVNGAGAPISIAATLTVAVASGPVFSPTSVTFSVAAGVTTPSTQTVTVSSQAAQFSFAATATVSNGSGGAVNWLSVSPATGTTPATLTITANPAGLASGQYAGIVTVTPTDGSIPTQNLSVILNIAGGSSTTFVKSVLSAASFLPGPISPGELVTIFGLNLGPTAGVAATPLASGAIDIQLAGTQVLFDGVAAPILYAQAGQLNVIVPYNVYGRTTTSLQVSISGVLSTPVGLAVQNTAPAVFTVNSKGTGQSAVINQDGTLNGPNFPAAGKSVISIYGTGEGQTSPPGQDGRLISTDLRHPIATFSATVGNVPAQVQYMGSAPTLVSGVFQMNIVVPAGLTPGQQPLQITVGGVTTQVAITVAVK